MNKEAHDTNFGKIDTDSIVATARTKMSLDTPEKRYNANKLMMGKDKTLVPTFYTKIL